MSVIAPTLEEIADLRNDIPDQGQPPIFTDAELTRFWVRAGGNHIGALILALDGLSGDAAKLSDYSDGQTRDNQSDIFDHLERRIARLRTWRGMGSMYPARSAPAVRGGF